MGNDKSCRAYSWYENLCANAKVDNKGQAVKSDCESRGCKLKNGICKPLGFSNGKTSKIKCKKLKFNVLPDDKGENLCGCMSGCKAKTKTKKGNKVFSGCSGTHQYKE